MRVGVEVWEGWVVLVGEVGEADGRDWEAVQEARRGITIRIKRLAILVFCERYT